MLSQIYIQGGKIYYMKRFLSFGNEITIKIKGNGEQTFIGNYNNQIESLYINDKESNFNKNSKTINLEDDLSEIKIKINLTNIHRFDKLFAECYNITEIDLSNFGKSSIYGMNEMFYNCYSLTSIKFGKFDTSQARDMQNMFKNCRSLKALNLINFDTSKVNNMYEMFSGCSNLVYLNLSSFKLTNVNDVHQMFDGCSNLTLLDLSFFHLNDSIRTDNIFSGTPLKMVIYMEEENSKIENILQGNCNEIEIYQDEEKEKFYFSCQDINLTNIEIIINKYLELDAEYILDTSLNITNSIEIINKDINSTNNIFEDETSSSYNINIYKITTLSNQSLQDSSFIYFGDCENLLKSGQNLNNDTEELYIYKKENFIEGIKIPIIEYEIYSKNGTKLNLDICKNNNINVTYFITVPINETELFKYDPESDFYKNRCDKYTTENNTDITLYDRKNEYNEKNLSLCEINCTFKEYNSSTSKVKCECLINTGFNKLNKSQIDYLYKLKSDKNVINMNVMKCSEILTSKEDLKSILDFFY